jgi:CheY-like chemotaxis protein
MTEEPTILIVDENQANRAVLFDYLDDQEYRVLLAERGEAAVEIASLIRPDLILMDVTLPGIDGYETCRQLRRESDYKDTPIILMSALDNNETRREGFKAGANAYITKPVLYEELSSLVDTYLKLRNYEALSQKTKANRERLPEGLDTVLDMIAHDMKSPIVATLGFATELEDAFSEQGAPMEWLEYTSVIKKCSADMDLILEALVLLKNLILRGRPAYEVIRLEECLDSCMIRYESLEDVRSLNVSRSLQSGEFISDPTLLEELILILWRNFSSLNSEHGENLSVRIESETNHSGLIELKMEASTRKISSSELPHLLEPMQGRLRTKVKDTNILMVCAQKLIEQLTIKARAESTDLGLLIVLTFPDID